MSAIEEKKGDSDRSGHTPPDSTVEHAEINEKALLRKLDGRLLPAVGVLYLLSFLDRSNGTYLTLIVVTTLAANISCNETE